MSNDNDDLNYYCVDDDDADEERFVVDDEFYHHKILYRAMDYKSTRILAYVTRDAEDLARQININAVIQPYGETLLHKAARNKDDIVIRTLLDWGADPLIVDSKGKRPFGKYITNA